MSAYKKIRGTLFIEKEVDDMIKVADVDGDGKINYDEWLMAAVNSQRVLQEENLKSAFYIFDKNGDGKITMDEINDILGPFAAIDQDMVGKLLNSAEKKKKIALSFEEFKTMLIKLFE